jgi:hypothetical protein
MAPDHSRSSGGISGGASSNSRSSRFKKGHSGNKHGPESMISATPHTLPHLRLSQLSSCLAVVVAATPHMLGQCAPAYCCVVAAAAARSTLQSLLQRRTSWGIAL